MSSSRNSFLHQKADYFIWTPVDREADQHNLAPTCSTIAQMAMGDALALCLSGLKNFKKKDFARNHPGGMLGKALLMKVGHLLYLHDKPSVVPEDGIDRVILEMTEKRLGATAVVDEAGSATGIITDGDLRRMLMKHSFSDTLRARDIMTLDPIVITPDRMATDAIREMQKHSITQLIVVENGEYKGMVHLHDLLKEGFVPEQ